MELLIFDLKSFLECFLILVKSQEYLNLDTSGKQSGIKSDIILTFFYENIIYHSQEFCNYCYMIKV